MASVSCLVKLVLQNLSTSQVMCGEARIVSVLPVMLEVVHQDEVPLVVALEFLVVPICSLVQGFPCLPNVLGFNLHVFAFLANSLI